MKRVKVYCSDGVIRLAAVDDVDFQKVNRLRWTGRWSKTSHDWLAYNGKLMMASLIAKPGPGQQVDHRNHSTLDNRRANLRVCSQAENLRNRRGWSQKTEYKGVRWKAQRRPGKGPSGWFARIQVNSKRIESGIYATQEEAAKRYNELALEHHGEFAYLNKLPAG